MSAPGRRRRSSPPPSASASCCGCSGAARPGARGELGERARRRARLVRGARAAVRRLAAGTRVERVAPAEVRLADGATLRSAALADGLRAARGHAVLVLAVSAGREVAAETRRLWASDRPDEAFFLDRFAAAVTEALVLSAAGGVCRDASRAGETLLPPLSPGCGRFEIGDQHRLMRCSAASLPRRAAAARPDRGPGVGRARSAALAARRARGHAPAARRRDAGGPVPRVRARPRARSARAPLRRSRSAPAGGPMSQPALLDALRERVLLGDGAMGTEIQNAGLESGGCGEAWNLDHPERVLAIQRRYVEAGSDVLLSHTFGACRIMLNRHGEGERTAEINRAAVRDRAAGARGPRLRARRHRAVRRADGAVRRHRAGRGRAGLPGAGAGARRGRRRRRHHRDPDGARGAGDRDRGGPRGRRRRGDRLDRLRQDGRRGRRPDDDGHLARSRPRSSWRSTAATWPRSTAAPASTWRWRRASSPATARRAACP